MKKLILGLTVPLILLIFKSSVFAQVPDVSWEYKIGGSSHDILQSIKHTSDGGYLLGGYSMSNASGDKTENYVGSSFNNDYWVVKLNASGDVVWDNTIGGDQGDELHSIIQTSDGGYLLGGFSSSSISGDKTESNNGLFDYWIVKLDALGSISWQNTIGGDRDDKLYSIIQTSDGGYLLGGISHSGISGDKTEANKGPSTSSDFWVLKLDGLGNVIWDKTIGGDSDDYLEDVKQTSDGGYILAGYSESDISGDKTEDSRRLDYWIVKINSAGVITWQNTLGGSSDEFLYSIEQTSDDGYILGGYSDSGISGDKTEPSRGGVDYWAVKLNSTGGIVWQKGIGGSAGDFLHTVIQTSDGGYFLGGYSGSNESLDKTEDAIDQGHSDYWVLKLNSTGDIDWQKTIGSTSNDFLLSVDKTSDDGYILGGYTWSNGNGLRDYWAIKLNLVDPSGINVNDIDEVSLYPNPINDYLTIECKTLYSKVTLKGVTGEILYSNSKPGVNLEIPTKHLSPGVYFLTLFADEDYKVFKIIKE